MQIHRAILGVMVTEEEYQAYEGDDVIVEYVLRADAQAKSLADERRIMDLEAQLSAERTRRLAAEDIVDRSLAHFPEKKLRALAHGYRTQYPRVEDGK